MRAWASFRVRPEDESEVLASLRNAGTQHEVGQKVELSGRQETVLSLGTAAQSLFAQKVDVQHV